MGNTSNVSYQYLLNSWATILKDAQVISSIRPITKSLQSKLNSNLCKPNFLMFFPSENSQQIR